MIFGILDLYNQEAVDEYFQSNYPRLCEQMRTFRLSKAKELVKILSMLGVGEQITLHPFPGHQLGGNGYVFPRFLRIEANGGNRFKVTREKAVRERYPAIMSDREVIEYYFELADISFLSAEEEIKWNDRWPPENKWAR